MSPVRAFDVLHAFVREDEFVRSADLRVAVDVVLGLPLVLAQHEVVSLRARLDVIEGDLAGDDDDVEDLLRRVEALEDDRDPDPDGVLAASGDAEVVSGNHPTGAARRLLDAIAEVDPTAGAPAVVVVVKS